MAKITDLPCEVLQTIFKDYFRIPDRRPGSFQDDGAFDHVGEEIIKLAQVCRAWESIALEIEYPVTDSGNVWFRVERVQGSSRDKYKWSEGFSGTGCSFYGIIGQPNVTAFSKDGSQHVIEHRKSSV